MRRFAVATDFEPCQQETGLVPRSTSTRSASHQSSRPIFFNRAACCSDHSLHRLNRHLNSSVALRTFQLSACPMIQWNSSALARCPSPRLCPQTATQFQKTLPSAFGISSPVGFLGTTVRKHFPFLVAVHEHWISGSCLTSALPFTECFHQLQNGRCVISCSNLSCSLVCRGPCVREFLPHSGSRSPPEYRRHLVRIWLFEPSFFRRPRTCLCSNGTTNTPFILFIGIL